MIKQKIFPWSDSCHMKLTGARQEKKKKMI